MKNKKTKNEINLNERPRLKKKKQTKEKPRYLTLDEQVREYAEIIAIHLLNNPQLWQK